MDLFEKIEQAAEAGVQTSASALEEIIELVKEGTDLEETIESLEEALKAQQGRFTRIKMYLLPEKMKLAGLGEFTTADKRVKVKIAQFVSGNIPKEDAERTAAFEKLIEYGGQSLIKSQVIVDFAKSEHNAMLDIYAKVLEMCTEMKIEEPTMKESVHAQTLHAFIREALKKGDPIEPADLGCHVGDNAKFEFFGDDGKKKKKAAAHE